MANIDTKTTTNQERLARIAASYGTTPERLIAAAARREAQERQAFEQEAARKPVGRKRTLLGFHVGESTTGWRR